MLFETAEKIIIIGAGPAGLLLAHYLLHRGDCQVEIYDCRPDPRSLPTVDSRSFPISLELKSLAPINVIPGWLEALGESGVWCSASVENNGANPPHIVPRKTPVLLISRNQLTGVLLNALCHRYSQAALTLRFNCALQGIDWTDQKAMFHADGDADFAVGFDRLVAADGAHSSVRNCLVEAGLLQCQQVIAPDAYKTFSIPRGPLDRLPALPPDHVQVWISPSQSIRTVLAPRPQDDRIYGAMMCDREHLPWPSLTSAEQVLEFFQQYLPSLGQRLSLSEAEILYQQPTYSINTVKCDRLHVSTHTLLIGDAAHAISPTTGRGCLSALQDAMIFAQVLDQNQGNWDKALPAFTTQRLPEVHALNDLPNNSVSWKGRVKQEQKQAMLSLLSYLQK